MPREIPISGETIKLGQLLKLAGVVGSGSEVKAMLAGEPVLVNRASEGRRGRQLRVGDSVSVAGEELVVTAASPSPRAS
ncbi:MAG TPA: RNA-binding S4 domain-containing protein [Solirubrobacteraceae bacterium]